jgi:hypothetical protein
VVGTNLAGIFDGAAADPPSLARVCAREETAALAPVELPDWASFGSSVAKIFAGCILLRDLAARSAALGHLTHSERLSLLYSLGHLGEPGARAIHAIIAMCGNYDRAETERQIRRLSGLPIGCSRMREKHATAQTLPQCNCAFDDVRRRGGYPTPLLHAGGFRRGWRDILRGRRHVEARARDGEVGGVTTVEEEGPPPAADSIAHAPPHTWA